MTQSEAPPVTSEEIIEAVNEARDLRHPHRSMRVTLECAHHRLMPFINTVMGIGAQTACSICPPESDGHTQARTVVNVEETGFLDDTWLPWRTAQKQRSASGEAPRKKHRPSCATQPWNQGSGAECSCDSWQEGAISRARREALTEAWQAVDRAITPLGYGGGVSNSPRNAGYEQAKNEALNAILALRDQGAPDA